jgi:Na+-driven multidrug efflux pump
MISAKALGAATVLINVTLVAILPGMALGLAAASLVGQALGRNEPDDASAWAFDVVKVGVVILGLLGAPMWIAPDLILEFFIPGDPATVAIAIWPMRLVGITMVGEAFGLILMHALLGAGATMTVMKVSIGLQWLLFLPLAWVAGPILGYGLIGVYIVQGGYRLLQSLVFLYFWRRGDWREIEV